MLFKTLFVAFIVAPFCQGNIIDQSSFDEAMQSFDLPAPRFQIAKQGIESNAARSDATSIATGHSVAKSKSKAIAEGSNNSDKLYSAHNADSTAKSMAQDESKAQSDSYAHSLNK